MKIRLILILLLLSTIAVAQKTKNNPVYLFDRDWKPTTKAEKAVYIIEKSKIDDTTYRWKYYNFSGPLISVETTRDEEGNEPNGYVAFYDKNGRLDSSGTAINGKKHDTWNYYTDSLKVWKRERYDNGRLLERLDTLGIRLERERNEQKYGPDDVLVEASYKNGDKDWVKYLYGKLKVPKRIENLDISGELIISFEIGKEGKIEETRIDKSLEYTMDQTAIDAITHSPNWKPATINGKPVKAYRRQPLNVRSGR